MPVRLATAKPAKTGIPLTKEKLALTGAVLLFAELVRKLFRQRAELCELRKELDETRERLAALDGSKAGAPGSAGMDLYMRGSKVFHIGF
jgi:hypothetical protein